MKHRQFINSALLDNDVGKIELWGDVMESKPCDWWTGEPLDIQCITPQDFKEAMAGLENCSTIELHLNSYGGDATVGIAIGNLLKQSDETSIFIYPGYKFKIPDAILTNFHLPQSTLVMLVSAFSTRENILNAYKVAIDNKYRFFSSGDAMLLK